MNKDEIITKLNKVLSQEHACAIRYATHAACISGPYAELVSERLKEISNDETHHAELLRQRILALGGIPTMEVATEELVHATSLDKILDINIQEERQAIDYYKEIIKSIPREEVILYQTIQDIIRDEEEHLEELQNLQ